MQEVTLRKLTPELRKIERIETKIKNTTTYVIGQEIGREIARKKRRRKAKKS